MGLEEKQLALDAGAWLANGASSVALIFFTKVLMTKFRFNFATTITALHFIATALCTWGARQMGAYESADVAFKYVALLALASSLAISFATYSLLFNTVAVYQVAKFLTAPGISLIEAYWLGKQFTIPVLISLATIVAGVIIFVLGTATLTISGIAVAALHVTFSILQQVMVWSFQQRFKVESHQLLAEAAPVQGILLLLAGPLADRVATGHWLSQWEVNVPGIETLLITCALAVAANYSQYLFLNRFSLTQLQQLNLVKALAVILGCYFFLHEAFSSKQITGIVVALLGLLIYSISAKRRPTTTPPILKSAAAAGSSGSSSGSAAVTNAAREAELGSGENTAAFRMLPPAARAAKLPN